MNIRYFRLIVLFGLMACYGCNGFLDAKPDKKLSVPSSLGDLQALMDNYSVFSDEPNAGELSADDYYLTTDHWLSLSSEAEKRTHIWEKDYLFDAESNSWTYFSTAVYYCNSVLEGLEGLDRNAANAATYDNVKGQALYFRAKRFLQASFIWSLAYDETSAETDLGLPLRLDPDFNVPSVRASVGATYRRVLTDLKEAVPLLPVVPLSKVRPSKPAAYALLARAYLSMRKYEKAGLYADSCLQLYSDLIDYNSLDTNAKYPLARFNKEVISENGMSAGQALNLTRGKVNPDLYKLYGAGDLRKAALFSANTDGSYSFKGRFVEGTTGLFGGMATNEMFLTRAECYARRGRVEEAMAGLNALLVKRWKAGRFSPLAASGAEEALSVILRERRKELLFRGIRWMDLKRLNKEGANITLMRTVNGQVYTLLPNDLRYALPLPEDVIALSGMPQNPR